MLRKLPSPCLAHGAGLEIYWMEKELFDVEITLVTLVEDSGDESNILTFCSN